MKCPCYQCEERHRNCHAHCVEYKEYKAARDKMNSEKHKQNTGEQSYVYSRRWRRYE